MQLDVSVRKPQNVINTRPLAADHAGGVRDGGLASSCKGGYIPLATQV